jgi:hypothetical protein
MVRNLRPLYYNAYVVYQNREIRGFALEVATKKLNEFIAAHMASSKTADDYKASLVAAVEEDAENYSWYDL